MGSAAIQSTFCGREEKEDWSQKTVLMCVPRVPPVFSWNFLKNFLKAFSNSLQTLPDGSNDGASKFGDCRAKYQEKLFSSKKKLHPMIPAKAENLLINVDQLPRQEIRRPGSDV